MFGELLHICLSNTTGCAHEDGNQVGEGGCEVGIGSIGAGERNHGVLCMRNAR